MQIIQRFKGLLILFIVSALIFISVTPSFAADGDLVVNGKVGIGTTSPGAKLSVVADTGGYTTDPCTGGTAETVGTDIVRKFTTIGDSALSCTSAVTAEVLLVAGGGGGGSGFGGIGGGGGGAGGLQYNASYAIVAQQNYTVTVGNGGTGAVGGIYAGSSSPGADSVFGTLTAKGGGRGGTWYYHVTSDGGSGGGGSFTGGDDGIPAGAATQSPGYGNAGGNGAHSGVNSANGGGGGGGADSTGALGTESVGGNGGSPRSYSISGSSVAYAGGGGGGCTGPYTAGTAGSGGGNGANNGGTGSSATANRGGGGGGGSENTGGGGNGGSGIVIVRYPATAGTTGTVATFTGGNVGIGTMSPATKLDVSGDIRLGNSNSSCTTANEGAMRYNSTTKVMEFCNGTNWVTL